ncbi:zinc finger, CCHC-type containing protein [Tanacetum coccineum]
MQGLRRNIGGYAVILRDKLPPSWKDFKHTLKHGKDDLSLVQLDSHLRIEESLRAQDSDKGKGKDVVGPSVNMTEEGGKNKNNKQNKGKKGKKRGFNKNNGSSGSNKKPKLECWKCGKTGHFKRDCRSGNKKNNANAGGSGKESKDQSYDKGFGYYNNGMFILNLKKVPDDSGSVYMSSSTVVNSSLWHAHLGHVHYKRMLEMSKDDLIHAIDENPKNDLCDFHATPSLGIIHETTASYTPQQNGVAKRKNRALKEMINSVLSYSGLSEEFWGEAMLMDCYLLNRLLIKRNKTTPYELRRGDCNIRINEGEESENPFFEGDGSSLFALEIWEGDGVADDNYKESPVFDDDQYEDVIEKEKGFVDSYPNFQEDKNNMSFSGVVLGVEEESMPVYDTDIEDVIEEEEGFVRKGGFGGEEDNI